MYVIKNISDVLLPKDFDCGEPALNNFLLNSAKESESRGLSKIHILCEQKDRTKDDNYIVKGYFSLTSSNVRISDLPEKMTKRYPNYVNDNGTIPTTLLARLARDKRYYGEGVGSLLLINALKTVAKGWDYVNSIGLLVHAKHEDAAKFYREFGFFSLPSNNLHLFMPRKSVLGFIETAR